VYLTVFNRYSNFISPVDSSNAEHNMTQHITLRPMQTNVRLYSPQPSSNKFK